MIELHVEDAPSAVLQPDQAQVIRAVSPTIDAERTEEGALFTIHDIDGTKEITVYDGEQGEPGQDGVSPIVTVASITGGHRITITDADGAKTVDVMDGADGDDGRGIASIAKTGTAGLVDTYTITYTDDTTSTFAVTNGQKGDPGDDGVTFTPTVSEAGVISWTNDGGRTNPQPVNIKGPQGDDYVLTAQDKEDIAELVDAPVQSVNNKTGAVVLDAQDVGAYEKPASGIPASDLAAGVIPAVPVQDVQVNGVSVLTDGVANVPKASQNSGLGVVAAVASNGIAVNANGQLYISAANADQLKAGSNVYKPIVPSIQHASTFYGLAKSAGDTTQSSSSNPVGTYTDAAKSAISTMLNGSVSVSGTTPVITALPGIRYVCGEVATLDITLPASGIVDVVFESGSTATVLTITPPTGVTLKWANGFDPTALEANTTYEINIADGLGVAGSWT